MYFINDELPKNDTPFLIHVTNGQGVLLKTREAKNLKRKYRIKPERFGRYNFIEE